MNPLQEKHKLLLIGVLAGITYGLLVRFVFDFRAALPSIVFFFIVPIILGIIPLMFANKEQLKSFKNIIFIPWLSLGAFFITMLLLDIEGILCLLILSAPFILLATIGAFIYRYFQINKQKNIVKLSTLALLPFLISPVEEYIKSPSETFKITSEIVITSNSENVWNNIVEIREISDKEYNAGIFNDLGIPRPISATVDRKERGGKRTGNFEGGLTFNETITEFQPNKKVDFSIIVDPKSVRNEVFDQHVLKGNYFTFVDAEYELTELENGKIRLKLSSQYQLTSKINFYGKFWGDLILKDFQNRLLEVLKNRCE